MIKLDYKKVHECFVKYCNESSQNLHFFHFAPCLSAIIGKEVQTTTTLALLAVFTKAQGAGDGEEMDISDFISLVNAFDNELAMHMNEQNDVLLEAQVDNLTCISPRFV